MYDLFTEHHMKGRCRMKKKVTISLDEDIITRLKQLAEESHRNMSQWVTEKVWEEAKETEQMKYIKLKG